MEKLSTVCVTGATGYIGDESKVQLLKKLEGADERLRLFEADLYDSKKFELAINGCDFVFLVATPLLHNPNSQASFFLALFLRFHLTAHMKN
ncbi:hypothetical protein M5K25_003494 [Dendrobium thyrsiflorum]|uniref:NmrA-like domain-containing protein n=1 Tax=Dendrobium thyrsiflorum TaxID=117978 RepID=A0ABD0VQR1_DENTH